MELELDITGLSNDGRGVARPGEGSVVFVAGALPGERVLAVVTGEKRGFREAVCSRVIEPAPDAVTPPCPHAGACGGCPLMRMPYARQLRWKRRLVMDALSRIGRMGRTGGAAGRGEPPALPVADIVPSPSLSGHRNKVELAFGVDGGRLRLGMRRRLSHDVVPVPGCLLVPAAARGVIGALEELAGRQPCLFPGREERRRQGGRRCAPAARVSGLRHCVLRIGLPAPAPEDATDAGERIWVILVTGKTAARERRAVRALAGELLLRCPPVHAVVHEERVADDRLARGENRVAVITRRGDDPAAARMVSRVGGRAYELDCADFFQVNAPAAENLAGLARGLLAPGPLLDLYCGVGAPGLSCVRGGAVTGIEYSASSVTNARANAARFGVPADYRVGDAARLIRAVAGTGRFDQALCDPPRGGLAPEVTAALLAMAPRRLCYISCNPATLARDIAALSSRYRVDVVTPVDLFPHTPHVETVTGLTLRP